jgi:lambda repressor-like predicted transcriptional regulator
MIEKGRAWFQTQPGVAPRGEKNGRAKMTWRRVRRIRNLHRKGVSLRELGRMFRLDFSTVGSIVRRETWKE